MSETVQIIGYLARKFPHQSEIFVTREIVALRKAGVEVKPFSLFRPAPASMSLENTDILQEVKVIVRPSNPLFWLLHILYAVRCPRRYFRCLRRWVLCAAEPARRLRSLLHFAAAPFAAWLLRRAGVSHLHAHFGNSPASVAMMACELARIPFSFTVHAYDIFVDDILLHAKLQAAEFVVVCSRFNAEYLREHYPEAAEAVIELVRYGIDPEAFSPRPLPFGEAPVLLAVGRLVETKGFHTLIEACARMRDAGVKIQCFIVGDGPERKRLERQINELRLTDCVYLPGKLLQPEVMEYYHRADVFVMPSCVRNNDRDGIPNVLLEAMAMEIPVVSTRVSGIPELVRDGETGLLVEPDDSEVLSEAVGLLLHDREVAARLAKAGRELVAREFNIEKSANELKALFSGKRRTSLQHAI